MKKSELRHAVSTVRWSIDQRLSIEAKLRQDVRKPEPIDDSDEEFIETDLVTMDDVMTEEDMRMERKRIIKRTVIGLLAAAVRYAQKHRGAVCLWLTFLSVCDRMGLDTARFCVLKTRMC